MKVSNHLQYVACSAMMSFWLTLPTTTAHAAEEAVVSQRTHNQRKDVSEGHSLHGDLRLKTHPRLIPRGTVILPRGKESRFHHISAAEVFDEDSLLLFGDEGGKWLHVKLEINEYDELTGVKWLNKEGKILFGDNALEKIESVAWYDPEEKELLLSVDETGEPLYVVKVEVDINDWTAKKVDMSGLEGFAPFERENGSDNGIEGITCLDPEKKSFLCISELQGIQKPPKKNFEDLTAKDLEALKVLTDKRLAWRVDVKKEGTNWEDSDFTVESSPSPLRYNFGNHDYKHLDVGGLTSLGDSVFALHKHWDGSKNEMQIVRISNRSILNASPEEPKFRGDQTLYHAESPDAIDNSEAIVAFERGEKKFIVTFTDDNYKQNKRSEQRVIATLFEIVESAPSSDESLSDAELGDDCCPKTRIEDRRARVVGRDGGGDAVIWVKFPALEQLQNRRPKVSINFTEYAWAGTKENPGLGTFRTFRTHIPDGKARRYYISASDGLVPNVTGREYDAKIDSYYVNLAPGTTAKVIFREPKTEVDDSRGLVYRWGKTSSGNFQPRDKATIDKNGLMQLADGAFLPLGVNKKVFEECTRHNQLTIELTLKTNKQVQTGPARIVSFSKDASSRNFTLGQDGENLVLRLRTQKNGGNASAPQVTLAKIVTSEPMHIIISYRAGMLLWYVKVKGKSVLTKSDELQGDFGNWEAMTLILGDELKYNDGIDRDWKGSIERLTIRSRFLDSEEATRQFELIR